MTTYKFFAPDQTHVILPGTPCWVKVPNPLSQPGDTPLPAQWTPAWFQSWHPDGAVVLFAASNIFVASWDIILFSSSIPS